MHAAGSSGAKNPENPENPNTLTYDILNPETCGPTT
jgi:hypothetical protein